ncbi:Uncharacterised protein [Rothia dentocariosa]|uniref:Uncharacterized protein n=1 Tax=Rothia dentocariosa TaxID=2047 RepID=A0A448UT72_9MICC|nr:Uncharacterised protein [Rothia dentocariosa]
MKNLIIFDHPYTAEAWRNIPISGLFALPYARI